MALTRKIRLLRYKWQQSGCTLATGYIREGDTFVSNKSLADKVDAHCIDFDHFKALTGQLSGQYSLVVEKEHAVWIACCPTWSFPLFYHLSSSGLCISDDPREIIYSLKVNEIRKDIAPYFLNFGVTPQTDTLIPGIQQVRPGEVIRFSTEKIEKVHYLGNLHREKGLLKSAEETYALLLNVFEKYSGYLKDRKVLVPLTGGYDSRLIACMLKETGHKNVVCATWGRAGNAEMITAEKVSKALGFEWLSVPSDDKVTPGFWKDDVFNRYIDWSGHFSSMPYLQDYFAVRFLKETGVIDEKTVALPGHPGDFLRGSHLYYGLPRQSASEVIDSIAGNFGTSLPLTKAGRASVRKIIADAFFSNDLPFDPATAYERWDYEERQCKFIGNSSQVYPFFGIQSMMPLFDKELTDFFLALPFEQRLGASLYNKTLENLVFKPCGCDVDFKSPEGGMKQGKGWKHQLLKLLPPLIRAWYYPVKDDAFYREITGELIRSDDEYYYVKPLKSHYYNGYLTQWYRYRVVKQLQQAMLS